jgi:serine/threonine-protein kinase
VKAPGDVIADKYEVERVLGTGGMGVVLAARHRQLGQRVAIKFIRGEAAQDPAAVGRFLREARSAVALSSEHVARVLDVGTLDTGEPYTVMEYLDGADLGQLLRQHGPMPIGEAVDSVLQACEAIAEAHALGIVHRDLKPANLFVSRQRDGTTIVKVLDFGISKVSAFDAKMANENFTASGLVMGSPGYMSPEQVTNAKAVDARSDIWSLGVILYELVSGQRPFAGETLGEVLARIVSESPPSVRQHRREVPEGLAQAIAKCLERRLDRRIQNVGELASKLLPYGPPDARRSVERILRWRRAPLGASPHDGETLTTPPAASGLPATPAAGTEPPWLRSSVSSRRSPHRSRGPILAIAAGVAAVLVVSGVYLLGGRPTSNPTSSTAAPSNPASPAATPPLAAYAPPGEIAAADSAKPNVLDAVVTGALDSGPPNALHPTPNAPGEPPPRSPAKPLPARRRSPASNPAPTNNEPDIF